jgi:hypothetical protein
MAEYLLTAKSLSDIGLQRIIMSDCLEGEVLDLSLNF